MAAGDVRTRLRIPPSAAQLTKQVFGRPWTPHPPSTADLDHGQPGNYIAPNTWVIIPGSAVVSAGAVSIRR